MILEINIPQKNMSAEEVFVFLKIQDVRRSFQEKFPDFMMPQVIQSNRGPVRAYMHFTNDRLNKIILSKKDEKFEIREPFGNWSQIRHGVDGTNRPYIELT